MSGTVFNYFDGYLRVIFYPVRHGMVPFDVVLHGDVTSQTPCNDQLAKGEPDIVARADAVVRMHISSALGGFRCLISWLEAITCGVQECACFWDGEGPDGELRWTGASDSGLLTVSWTGEDEERRVRLNKAQPIRAFYESFRNYVESNDYDPLDYEQLNAGETFALIVDGAELDELAAYLSTLSRDRAEKLIHEMLDLAFDTEKGHPRCATLAQFAQRALRREDDSNSNSWISEEWDAWNGVRRRQHLVDEIWTYRTMIGFGEKLRELRSPIIEPWLARHAGNAPAGHDA